MNNPESELLKMIRPLKEGNEDEVICFAHKHGFDTVHVVSGGFMNDHTLVTFSIIFSSPEMLTALLMGGASTDVYSNMGYTSNNTVEEGGPMKMYTPLHYCALQNKLDHAEVLLEFGADISLLNNQGETAFDMATSDKMRELIRLYELPRNVPCAEETFIPFLPSDTNACVSTTIIDNEYDSSSDE